MCVRIYVYVRLLAPVLRSRPAATADRRRRTDDSGRKLIYRHRLPILTATGGHVPAPVRVRPATRLPSCRRHEGSYGVGGIARFRQNQKRSFPPWPVIASAITCSIPLTVKLFATRFRLTAGLNIKRVNYNLLFSIRIFVHNISTCI